MAGRDLTTLVVVLAALTPVCSGSWQPPQARIPPPPQGVMLEPLRRLTSAANLSSPCTMAFSSMVNLSTCNLEKVDADHPICDDNTTCGRALATLMRSCEPWDMIPMGKNGSLVPKHTAESMFRSGCDPCVTKFMRLGMSCYPKDGSNITFPLAICNSSTPCGRMASEVKSFCNPSNMYYDEKGDVWKSVLQALSEGEDLLCSPCYPAFTSVARFCGDFSTMCHPNSMCNMTLQHARGACADTNLTYVDEKTGMYTSPIQELEKLALFCDRSPCQMANSDAMRQCQAAPPQDLCVKSTPCGLAYSSALSVCMAAVGMGGLPYPGVPGTHMPMTTWMPGGPGMTGMTTASPPPAPAVPTVPTTNSAPSGMPGNSSGGSGGSGGGFGGMPTSTWMPGGPPTHTYTHTHTHTHTQTQTQTQTQTPPSAPGMPTSTWMPGGPGMPNMTTASPSVPGMPTSTYITPTATPCVDDPFGDVARDPHKDCANVGKQPGWNCDYWDHDFNGKSVYIWQLCPRSCNRCSSLSPSPALPAPGPDRHDPSKCREHDKSRLDPDCCGYFYETWCADNYTKVHSMTGGVHECWPGQKGYKCYPTPADPKDMMITVDLIYRSKICNVPATPQPRCTMINAEKAKRIKARTCNR